MCAAEAVPRDVDLRLSGVLRLHDRVLYVSDHLGPQLAEAIVEAAVHRDLLRVEQRLGR